MLFNPFFNVCQLYTDVKVSLDSFHIEYDTENLIGILIAGMANT